MPPMRFFKTFRNRRALSLNQAVGETAEEIFQIAERLVALMIEQGFFPTLLGTDKRQWNPKANLLLLEMLVLCLHLVYRSIAGDLSPERRKLFMNELVVAATQKMGGSLKKPNHIPPQMESELAVVVKKMYRERTKALGTVAMLPEAIPTIEGSFWNRAAENIIVDHFPPELQDRARVLLPMLLAEGLDEVPDLRPRLEQIDPLEWLTTE